MDSGTFLVAVAIIAFTFYRAVNKRTLPATSDDWYVVFHENHISEEKKVLGLSFYPIIGFERKNDDTIPITSRPKYTAAHARSVIPEKGRLVGEPASRTFAMWVRKGVTLTELGQPKDLGEMDSDGFSGFSAMIENYLLRDFKLSCQTPIPVFYMEQINNAIERFKRWKAGI